MDTNVTFGVICQTTRPTAQNVIKYYLKVSDLGCNIY